MKIDIFPHILPPKYKEALEKRLPAKTYQHFRTVQVPFSTLYDLDNRFRILDKHEGLVQVLTLTTPRVEMVANPEDIVDLVKTGNDEMANLVEKYPDRFIAAVGSLPLHDIDLALIELDRIVNDLNFRGIQIGTDILGKPLDSPEFLPLFEKMEQYNLPILLHPMRLANRADYVSEEASKFDVYMVLGWPYETSVAMTRLIYGQVLEKHPNLKIITHHCGGMVPYFEQRIRSFSSYRVMRAKMTYTRGLTRSPMEYYKMFYGDTAVNGSTAALMCGYSFFGADHILFGTDMPYDNQNGSRSVEETIESIEQMQIPDSDKKKIFEDNARTLFRLPV